MDPDRAVELTQSVAALTAAWRLVGLNLAKRYLGLSAWLVVLAVGNLVAAVLSRFASLYFWFYIIYVPLNLAFSIWAVREIFALVFADYPGIRSVGRWSMYAGIVFATTASILVARFFRRASTEGSRHLLYLEVSQRSVVFSLVIVIATILFILSKYPLHLGRNNYVSCGFFGVLFLSDAARLLVDSLQSDLHSDAVDLIEGVFIVVCLLGWALLLQPYAPPLRAAPPAGTEEEKHLLGQLASFNQLLEGALRR